MKIVLDENIPYIRETLESIADEVVCLAAKDINADVVRDADAMVIRTRTKCDEALLKGSKVQFIATATIGFDHIDADYMKRAGISWISCPGCNAGSVGQYVRSSLIMLSRCKGLDLRGTTLGIVGYGHVGHKVKEAAEALGMRVLLNDPPRQNAGCSEHYVSLENMECEADVITFHVPLVRGGKYPTWHLADEAFFGKLMRVPYIINSSRGGVVDNRALLTAMQTGKVKDAVIDTWENEPDINLELLQRVFIGTPHIAGYSADGKVNADNMVIEGLCKHFNIYNKYKIKAPQLSDNIIYSDDTQEQAIQLYNPMNDSELLKCNPNQFEHLRDTYPLRRESI